MIGYHKHPVDHHSGEVVNTHPSISSIMVFLSRLKVWTMLYFCPNLKSIKYIRFLNILAQTKYIFCEHFVGIFMIIKWYCQCI